MLRKKQHLTHSGFITILTYYASINRGISPSVSAYFPEIVGVKKETVALPENLNPLWVSGFVAGSHGQGGFSIGIRQETGQIYFRFHITQHKPSPFGKGGIVRPLRENEFIYPIF